ncbi:MAG: DNA topoisomerase VI subunit B, partial [Verrucomicrobia bacterium]|nr:DNA topoisomerase VI subunit B [Verrucomicrobiota bacterium]
MPAKRQQAESAESLAGKQREISVSEFFLKNRHLLGFDSPRKALMTTVKEAVDNALDACEEARIVPEISVEITQLRENRFTVSVTDNGPGVVRTQIPKIFAKLLYGSKFHRLRMSRGQQGIGISAAGMYGQLTTGAATRILSKTQRLGHAHAIDVQIDTQKNKPTILKDAEVDWCPEFPAEQAGKKPVVYRHGTCVSIDMEAAYVRGRLSVDEYIKQCAVVNPHLQLHYRVVLLNKSAAAAEKPKTRSKANTRSQPDADIPDESLPDAPWQLFARVTRNLPVAPKEIKPHPH